MDVERHAEVVLSISAMHCKLGSLTTFLLQPVDESFVHRWFFMRHDEFIDVITDGVLFAVDDFICYALVVSYDLCVANRVKPMMGLTRARANVVQRPFGPKT